MSPSRHGGCPHQPGSRCAECRRRAAEQRRARSRARGMAPRYANRVGAIKDPVEKAWAETEPEFYWPELAQ